MIHFLLYPDYRQHAKEKLKYKKVSLKITFHITNEVYAEVFPTKGKSTHQTFASTNALWFVSASRDNTDIFLCFEVQGNNDFILITARIWHKYYSKFSTQILLEGFDTHITARIRHRYYSKYSTQILQQEFVTNIIASFRHKYYSKYSTQILQKVFDTNITVNIQHKYQSKYSTQININSSNPWKWLTRIWDKKMLLNFNYSSWRSVFLVQDTRGAGYIHRLVICQWKYVHKKLHWVYITTGGSQHTNFSDIRQRLYW